MANAEMVVQTGADIVAIKKGQSAQVLLFFTRSKICAAAIFFTFSAVAFFYKASHLFNCLYGGL